MEIPLNKQNRNKMESKELRVGNWVNNNNSDYQITSATIAQLERGDSTAKPILITTEWLVYFGFKDHDYTMDKDGISLSWGSRVVSTGKRTAWSCDQYPHIKYVHQLQNLWLAIFDEEL